MSRETKERTVIFKDGIVLRNNSTPDSSLLKPGEVEIYWDKTDGSSVLRYRGKSADGTVVNGSADGTGAPTPDGPANAIQSYNGTDAFVGSADFTRDPDTGEVANTGNLSIDGDGSFTGSATVDTNLDVTGDVTVGGDTSLGGELRVTEFVVIKRTTAPADGALSANELALWFDPTDEAGKLMIKAKTADGTVVTGEVALA